MGGRLLQCTYVWAVCVFLGGGVVGVAVAGDGAAGDAVEDVPGAVVNATVYKTDSGAFQFVRGVADPAGFAYGSYAYTRNSTGWDVVNVHTNPEVSARDAMFAAGYLEAAFSPRTVHFVYRNVHQQMFGNQPHHDRLSASPKPKRRPVIVTAWVEKHMAWLREKATSLAPVDPWWDAVVLILAQLDGFAQGYADHRTADLITLPVTDLFILNMDGDMETLSPALAEDQGGNLWGHYNYDGLGFNTPPPTPPSTLNLAEALFNPPPASSVFQPKFGTPNHYRCSALIKLAPGNSDLWMSHDTWDSYGSMIRAYKHYMFDLKDRGSWHVSMSSTPTFLSSVDDWYITNKGLVIIETTNEYHNDELNKQLSPNTVLTWVRSMVANFMAQDGPTWIDIFSRENSGTYNNQWMVLDLNKFTPNQPTLTKGMFHVLEQLPGKIVSADMTEKLQRDTYWGSYNVPYFPEIRELSGFANLTNLSSTADEYSHDYCMRAKIFQRDAPGLQTYAEFQALMTSNSYLDDPILQGNPSAAVMSRYDLVVETPDDPTRINEAFGGIDSKTTTWSQALRLEVDATAGPTHNKEAPPFCWSKCTSYDCNHTRHEGQVETWDFGYVKASPTVIDFGQGPVRGLVPSGNGPAYSSSSTLSLFQLQHQHGATNIQDAGWMTSATRYLKAALFLTSSTVAVALVALLVRSWRKRVTYDPLP